MVASTSQPQMSGGSTPVPDPTILSTEALQREIKQLRELLESQIRAQKDICDEKFLSVGDKLALGERQRVEQKSDTEKAIQAALTAQKEAVAAQAASFAESVAKSETATARQLEQMQTTFKTEISNIATNQSDLKDRVGKIEFVKIGVHEQRTEGRSSVAGVYAAVGIAITVILAVMSIIAFAQ